MEKFVHLRTDYNEELTMHGIPFRVRRESVILRLPGCNRMQTTDAPVNGSTDWHLRFPYRCSCLFFLGMATESWIMSEWWGQQVSEYDHSCRVFIGDRIGRIKIVYADGTEQLIPVLFGVNCWNYHLFYAPHAYENLNGFGAPYDEPFRSDPEAMRMLQESLCLMENTEEDVQGTRAEGRCAVEKNTKWIFGVRVAPEKEIASIWLIREESKRCDFAVSAVTGLAAGYEPDPAWRITDLDFFLSKAYYRNADRLARRLYQFRDALPAHADRLEIDGFDAPDVTFEGNGLADIYTNIYRRNIMDMAYEKIRDDGHVNVSTPRHLDYGCYIGFGTYARNGGSDTTWTRDAGRSLTETVLFGYDARCLAAAEYLTRCLYTTNIRFPHPQWKRIANVDDYDDSLRENICQCKENDGHAAIMMYMYTLFRTGVLQTEWLYANRQAVYDAADFFLWQSRNPALTNFDRVLYTESESSAQCGGYDLFSNLYASHALRGYADMLTAMAEGAGGTPEDLEMAAACRTLSDTIYKGCQGRFTMDHPRYGDVYTDTLDDCWTYEYKRFADLFIRADIDGYDLRADCPETADKADRSFLAQKERYYSPLSGRQMGYGQGYLTETVLLLDRFEELTECVEGTAMQTYHHDDEPYMVPEGVIVHGSGGYWYRQADLGNAVQQGEVIKIARLMLGLDDLSAARGLRIVPRLPDTWTGLRADGMRVTGDGRRRIPVSYAYRRTADGAGYTLRLTSEKALRVDSVRFGPFRSAHIRVTDADTGAAVPCTVEAIHDRYFARVPIRAVTDRVCLDAVPTAEGGQAAEGGKTV